MTKTRLAKPVAVLGISASLLLSACAGGTGTAGNGGGELDGATFIVGSKEFTESVILGHITALALEDAGATTVDQTAITGSSTVRAALESGEIDIYWDYTGTAWVNILGNTTVDVPDDLYAAVVAADAANGIAWLEPAKFQNTYRIATGRTFAAEDNLVNTSDMAAFVTANPGQGTVCAASEFINRDDGLPGLQETYGFEFSDVVELDLNLIYTQIGQQCQFGEVFSTDARIVSNDLIVLEDDQGFFVEYQGLVTLRQETLDEYPVIADIMAPISAALTNDVITGLNGQVDNDGTEPRDVAEQWLLEEGFIG